MSHLAFTDRELEELIVLLEGERVGIYDTVAANEKATGERLHFLNNLLGKLVNLKNLRVLRGEWNPK